LPVFATFKRFYFYTYRWVLWDVKYCIIFCKTHVCSLIIKDKNVILHNRICHLFVIIYFCKNAQWYKLKILRLSWEILRNVCVCTCDRVKKEHCNKFLIHIGFILNIKSKMDLIILRTYYVYWLLSILNFLFNNKKNFKNKVKLKLTESIRYLSKYPDPIK